MAELLTLIDCMKYPNAIIRNKKGLELTLKGFISSCHGCNMDYFLRIDKCKLLLRDITQLTYEENKYIRNYFFISVDIDIVDYKDDTLYNILDSGTGEQSFLELFDYLRSISIDIDGFIKSGKAARILVENLDQNARGPK